MADPAIILDLIYLGDAPKHECGDLREETSLERMRCAWLTRLYANDVGITSMSPRGLTKAMAVIVVVFLVFGQAISEKKPEKLHAPVVSVQLPRDCAIHQSGSQADGRIFQPWWHYQRRYGYFSRNQALHCHM